VSKRAIRSIAILLVIAAGIYWLTYRHRVRETHEMMLVLASQDHDEAMEAMQRLKAHGVGLYPQLIDGIRTGVPRVRWRSAVLLGELGDQRAIEPLIELLSGAEPVVRAAAAQALGHLDAQAAIPTLIRLVNGDPELVVRTAAVRALGVTQAEDAAQELKTALKAGIESESEDLWQLRHVTAWALGAIATPEAVGGLAEVVDPNQEPDPRVRTAAAYALGDAGIKLQHEEDQLGIITQALLQAINDEVGDLRLAPEESTDDGSGVRAAAAHSLGLLTVPEDQHEEVAEALEQARSDAHYWVRQVHE